MDFCFGSATDGRRTARNGSSVPRSHRLKAVISRKCGCRQLVKIATPDPFSTSPSENPSPSFACGLLPVSPCAPSRFPSPRLFPERPEQRACPAYHGPSEREVHDRKQEGVGVASCEGEKGWKEIQESRAQDIEGRGERGDHCPWHDSLPILLQNSYAASLA